MNRMPDSLHLPFTTEAKLPQWPVGWYIVSRSCDLPKKGVLTGVLGHKEYIIFRTEAGKLGALNAHCPHMGAHLIHGKVISETIRCPIHHWKFSTEGSPTGSKTATTPAKTWHIEERFGLIFLFLGNSTPPPPLPVPNQPDQYRWIAGEVIELETDWHSMIVNGFDMPHLNAVHKRQLVEPAKIEIVPGKQLTLTYKSRVTGHSANDLVMKWLTKDKISVKQVCYGNMLTIETDLGFTKTVAVLGVHSKGSGIRALGAFGIRPGLFSGIRLRLARWLFTSFLRNDFRILEGMNLNLNVEDEGVNAMSTFLSSLPHVDAENG